MMHSTGNHLFLGLHHLDKFKQSILFLIVLIDSEASQVLEVGAVLGSLRRLKTAEGGHIRLREVEEEDEDEEGN
jgi:hypothetical protein